MLLFGVSESYHRSPFSVVSTLVPPAQQMAKRSRPSADEASKCKGALSKSKPAGKIVLALAAVRHEKSSPLISAQEKTQSNAEGQEKPSQASGDRLHFPGVQAGRDPSHKVQQSDDPSQENPGPGSGDGLAVPRSHRTRSVVGMVLLDDRMGTVSILSSNS